MQQAVGGSTEAACRQPFVGLRMAGVVSFVAEPPTSENPELERSILVAETAVTLGVGWIFALRAGEGENAS